MLMQWVALCATKAVQGEDLVQPPASKMGREYRLGLSSNWGCPKLLDLGSRSQRAPIPTFLRPERVCLKKYKFGVLPKGEESNELCLSQGQPATFFFSDALFFFFCATGGEILMHTQQGL